jgi:hypothetical protein
MEIVMENLLDGVPRPATTPKPEPSRPGYVVLSWLDVSMYQEEPIWAQHFTASLEEREALLHQMPLATVVYYELPEEEADAMWAAETRC